MKGVAIGNGFVSPADIVETWPLLLYHMSFIDDVQFSNLSKAASEIYQEEQEGRRNFSGVAVWKVMSYIDVFVPDLNFYDISIPFSSILGIYGEDINDLMNVVIRQKIGIIPKDVQWTMMAYSVLDSLRESSDFVKPVWHLLDSILKTSEIDVVVYSGQFDLMFSTVGALRWMNRLTWDGKRKFDETNRITLVNPSTNIPEMFVKSSGHLKMYWVLNAGHVVPADVPDVAIRMLNRILGGVD